jgi:protein ImuB
MSLEPLLFLLKPAIDRSMARLRARSKRASQIRLELELESGSEFKATPSRIFRLELPVPQGSAGAILLLLKTKLEGSLTRAPLRSPVVSLRFEIEKMVPGYGAQKHFFESTEEQSEAWDALTLRLLSELGSEGAFRATPIDTHVPENSWRAGPATAPAQSLGLTTLKVARPTRLLDPPEVLRFETFRSFVDWQGPERIETDWWSHSKEVVRDYFRVTTRGGEQLWVFRSFAQYFLHGYFD